MRAMNRWVPVFALWVIVTAYVAACGSSDEATGESTTTPPSTSTTTTTTQPITTTSTSTTTTTTSTTTTTEAPATPTSLPSPDIALDPTQPLDTRNVTLSDLTDIESLGLDGFVDFAIASEIGYYGTFTVAFPIGWRIWVVGEDPAQFVAVVEEKDPSYSRALNDMMEQSNAHYEAGSGSGPLLRAAFVDARPDHLVQVMVRLSNGADDLESLRQLTQDQYEAVGATILRLAVYPSEGGGSVESTALIPLGTGLEPRVQHQRLVVDQTNLRTWGLVCNIHESGNADSSDECWTLLRSISPLGYLIGP